MNKPAIRLSKCCFTCKHRVDLVTMRSGYCDLQERTTSTACICDAYTQREKPETTLKRIESAINRGDRNGETKPKDSKTLHRKV